MREKIKYILFIVLLLIGSLLRAHSPAETHSTIRLVENKVQVNMELPWSIAELVKEADEIELPAMTRRSFEELVLAYVSSRFTLMQDGVVLEQPEMQLQEAEEGHSLRVEFSYASSKVDGLEVSNRILFDHQSRQVNHHRVWWEGESMLYQTNAERPAFTVSGSSANVGTWARVLLLLLAVLLIFSFYAHKRVSAIY